MSNVLPYDTKRKLDARAWTRFIAVGTAASALAALAACLALLPAFISVRVARAALESATPEVQAAREDSGKASRAQILVDTLSPLVSTTTPSDALGAALALQPKSISVTSISYQAEPERLVLSGISSSREALTAFRTALAGSGRFSNIEVPVAALAGVQEGRFTMTLSGPF